MGRAVVTQARFQGQIGQVRALLEAGEVILRGDLRARIPRDQVTAWRVVGDDLHLATPLGPVILTVGASEARAWARALDKPCPTLRDKMGIAPKRKVFALTPVGDAALEAAIAGAVTPEIAAAGLLLAVIRSDADLARSLAVAQAHPDLPLWVANEKRQAMVSEAIIRTSLRAAGLIDTKSCAVSDTLSATRYGRRRT